MRGPTRPFSIGNAADQLSEMDAPMPTVESTCWTVIDAAAAGSQADRDAFVERYGGVIRAYLGARWRHSALQHELGDAAQDVFLECFRKGGVLEAAHAGHVTKFRAFLYGVIRNVARRFENGSAAPAELPPEVKADEESQSRLFERTWALAIMAEAAQRQARRAAADGPEALRRVELLQLRFQEGLPIRAIAERWNVPVETVHRAYAKAREEFKAALLAVIAFHHPGSPAAVEEEAADLLKSLS
jgi:RNA polymerase sigma factor (sigma-70 family)